MKKIALAVALSLLLASCATTRPAVKVEPVEVQVAVPVPCKPEQVPARAHPFDQLEPGADIFTQVVTLLADRVSRAKEIMELRAANSGCKPGPLA